MRTDPRTLHGTTCDLLVLGAGIQGAAIAREASQRGLRVVLVEARDVAAGTSSRSSRLVHGGLRYLRQGHWALVEEALGERERLLRQVPHLVRPLPMLMPWYPDGGAGRWLTSFGVRLYAWLAKGSTLPRPRSLSPSAALAAFPGLRARGLRGALEFYDAATDDARLCLANVLAAAATGASVVTHCRMVGAGGDGLHLVDELTGAEVRIGAAQIVNAAGPRVDAVRAALGIDGAPLVRLSRGSHLVLPPREGEPALAAFLPDRRIQFVIPHPGGTLCGTTEVDDGLGDEGGPPVADLDYLHGALAHLLEPVPPRSAVLHAYAGWRALPARPGPPSALHREAFTVTEPSAAGAVHTVVGGKLTTHRAFAERVVGACFGFTDPSPTRTTPLPGGAGPREIGEPLWWRHGSRVRLVRDVLLADPAAAALLCPHRPFLVAEAIAALRHDGAVTLADLLLRRLVHPLGPCLEPACLQRAHAVFVRDRCWPVDDDATAAIAAVVEAVQAGRGDLVTWRTV